MALPAIIGAIARGLAGGAGAAAGGTGATTAAGAGTVAKAATARSAGAVAGSSRAAAGGQGALTRAAQMAELGGANVSVPQTPVGATGVLSQGQFQGYQPMNSPVPPATETPWDQGGRL